MSRTFSLTESEYDVVYTLALLPDTASNEVLAKVGGVIVNKNLLSGTGFVKVSGTSITYDNSTYVTGTPWTGMGYLTSIGTGVANELTYWSGTNTIGSLATATYPSLTELAFVKGVTSAIQTQLNGKQATLTNPITGTGTNRQLAFFTGTTTQSSDAGLVFETRKTLTLNDGLDNVGIGTNALLNNTYASKNVAIGTGALQTTSFTNSDTAYDSANIAIGYQAGFSTEPSSVQNRGKNNCFIGHLSGYTNSIGKFNVFNGYQSGYSNSSGYYNCFIGANSGYTNTTGTYNIHIGSECGNGFDSSFNTIINNNFGNPSGASGSNNIILGCATDLSTWTSGTNNICIGDGVGYGITSGNNNLYIGNSVTGGTESNTVRIKNVSGAYSAVYVEGIYGATSASGIAVLINSSHKLGTTTSSIRYKENVVDMEDYSSKILDLRPVMFDYKDKPNQIVDKHQPGLIAEEVNEIMPDLVAWAPKKDEEGKETDELQIETVRYLNLIPLMLNEIKKLRNEIDSINK